MIIDEQCPYDCFEIEKCTKIYNSNPYKVNGPILEKDLITCLNDALYNISIGLESNFNPVSQPNDDNSIKLNKTLEVKPLRYTQFQKTKDFIKACLCAKKTIDGLIDRRDGPCTSLFLLNMGVYIESFIMDLDVDGVYRVFPFMKSILPIDKPSVMSLSPTLTHLIALQT
ncbi:19495_t:CDS:2 [Entrophospora sp. SA101]|nr:19495_t:CDS:2 [Entrophospora sp. SA101]